MNEEQAETEEDEGKIGLPVYNDMAASDKVQAEMDEDEAQIGLPADNDIAASDRVQAEDNHLQVLLLSKQAIISLQGMAKKGL